MVRTTTKYWGRHDGRGGGTDGGVRATGRGSLLGGQRGKEVLRAGELDPGWGGGGERTRVGWEESESGCKGAWRGGVGVAWRSRPGSVSTDRWKYGCFNQHDSTGAALLRYVDWAATAAAAVAAAAYWRYNLPQSDMEFSSVHRRRTSFHFMVGTP